MWKHSILIAVLLLPVAVLSEPPPPVTPEAVAPVVQQVVQEAKEAPTKPSVGTIVEKAVEHADVAKSTAQKTAEGPEPSVPVTQIGPIVDQVLKEVQAQKSPMEIVWSVLPMLVAFGLSFAGPYITKLGMKLGMGMSPPIQKLVSTGAGVVIAFLTGLLGSGMNLNVAEASAALGAAGGGAGHAVIQSSGIPTKAEAKADAKAEAKADAKKG